MNAPIGWVHGLRIDLLRYECAPNGCNHRGAGELGCMAYRSRNTDHNKPPQHQWESWEQSGNARNAFEVAGCALIRGGEPDEEPDETTSKAMSVVAMLSLLLGSPGPRGVEFGHAIDALHEMLSSEPGIERQKARAVQWMHEFGEHYHRAETEESRTEALWGLWNHLRVTDAALVGLGGQGVTVEQMRQAFGEFKGELAALMGQYSPNPKGSRGAKGAERLLAEWIVMYCGRGALGLCAKDDEADEAAVERIRVRLAKAVVVNSHPRNPA